MCQKIVILSPDGSNQDSFISPNGQSSASACHMSTQGFCCINCLRIDSLICFKLMKESKDGSSMKPFIDPNQSFRLYKQSSHLVTPTVLVTHRHPPLGPSKQSCQQTIGEVISTTTLHWNISEALLSLGSQWAPPMPHPTIHCTSQIFGPMISRQLHHGTWAKRNFRYWIASFTPMARGRQTVVLQTLICDGRFATSNTGEKHWLINMFPIEIAIWSASPHVLDKPKTMHCK